MNLLSIKPALLIFCFVVAGFLVVPSVVASDACRDHGGVDCRAGYDVDGSVICHDGWRDSNTQHTEYCSQTFLPTCNFSCTTDYLTAMSCLEVLCKIKYPDNQTPSADTCTLMKSCFDEHAAHMEEERVKKEAEKYIQYLANACPINAHRAVDGNCYCNAGYNPDGANGCVEVVCPDLVHGFLDKSDNQCYCKAGYAWSEGQGVCVVKKNSTMQEKLMIKPTIEPNTLIKNKQFAEVFFVDTDLCLHWIINEQIAEKYFGVTWNYEGNIREYSTIPSGYRFCDKLE